MSFSFSGRHMSVGSALTHHAAEACESLAAKYNDELIDVNIVMTKDAALFVTDLSVKFGHGESFYAKAEEREPYASFDAALRKITTQVKKFKSICDSNRNEKIEIKEDEEPSDESEFSIISELVVELPVISVAEAANRLVKEDKEVVMFRNKMTNAVNSVYKRRDGNVVWIDCK